MVQIRIQGLWNFGQSLWHQMSEKYERVDFMSTYGMIPYSIWESNDPKFSNPILKYLKERQGKSTRENTLKSFGGAGENTAYTATTSYFNPKLCKMVYSSYCPKNGTIFDPFSWQKYLTTTILDVKLEKMSVIR